MAVVAASVLSQSTGAVAVLPVVASGLGNDACVRILTADGESIGGKPLARLERKRLWTERVDFSFFSKGQRTKKKRKEQHDERR